MSKNKKTKKPQAVNLQQVNEVKEVSEVKEVKEVSEVKEVKEVSEVKPQNTTTNNSSIFDKAIQVHKEGKLDEAENLYKQELKNNPSNVHCICNLGYAYIQKKQYSEALNILKDALKLEKDYGNAYNLIGMVHAETGDKEKALESFKLAISNNTNNREVYNNLANIAEDLKQFTLAAQAWQKYMQLFKYDGKSLSSLMYSSRKILEWRDINSQEKKLEQVVHNRDGKLRMFTTLYSNLSPDNLKIAAACHSRYLTNNTKTITPKNITHTKNEKIKIGYFSADIKGHPVGIMTMHLFKNHNREQFEIYSYACAPCDGSPVTEFIQKNSDHFKDLSNLNDQQAFDAIQNDNLDILIDLCGYTKGNRQAILIHKPAPVIINWLGYMGTMGSQYHKYIVADKYLISANERYNFSEIPIHISCALAYERIGLEAPSLGTRKDHNLPEDGVIIGVFHQAAKISPQTFNVWMRILQKCPKAYLWLPKHDEEFAKNFCLQAKKYQLNEERFIFADICEVQYHQARYAHVDLMLDTFPYNGGITTTDALYAGCPVITLQGRTMVGRMGASLLNQIGMQDFVASSVNEYLQKACKLILAPEQLRSLREKVKEKARSSVIFNGVNMTKELETCYQRIVNNG